MVFTQKIYLSCTLEEIKICEIGQVYETNLSLEAIETRKLYHGPLETTETKVGYKFRR